MRALRAHKMQIELRPIDRLIPYARNARTHTDAQVAQIAASIKEFGWTNPILVDGDNGIIAGHGRVLAARKLGMETVPCIELAHLTDTQRKAYILADNQLALNAGWDKELLALELGELQADGFDMELIGFDDLADLLPADDGEPAGQNPSLLDRFGVAPFSVLNAREGWWQQRKRGWIGLGIQSELGRGPDAIGYSESCKRGYKAGKAVPAGLLYGEIPAYNGSSGSMSGTSIFDPVLCELAYRWFCPPNGLILDPFAGGSVRGIVASKLGRPYIGHELRAEQVAANREQADAICQDPAPAWIIGDSRNIDQTCKDVQADFLFTCPPYADLEKYSDDPADLSGMDYPAFLAAYREIIAKAAARLKPDRFACFVVGEVRGRDGNYYNFVGDTIKACLDAGLGYYNEAILVTMAGSLPIRTGKQFSQSRKLGKTHQNVLVFVKGNAKAATAACGPVEIDEALFPDVEETD